MTRRPSRLRRPLVWPFALAVGAHLVAAGVAVSVVGRHAGDFNRYWDLARSTGRAYRDYQAEYPPGALLVFDLASRLAGTRGAFYLGLVAMNLLADLAIIGGLLWAWGLEVATAYGVVALSTLSLLFFHFDLWPTAAAALGVAAWRREHAAWTAIALAVGTALKLWPILFAVLLLVPASGRRRLAPLTIFVWCVAVFAGFWWMQAGWAGIRQVVTFRGAEGWQVESSVGAALRAIDAARVRIEAGSPRIGRMNTLTSIWLFLIAAPASLAVFWQGARRGKVGHGWMASVSVLLVASTLLSPQFLGWLMPGAALAWPERGRRLTVACAAAGLLSILPLPPPFIVLRNVLLALMAADASLAVMRAERAVPPGG